MGTYAYGDADHGQPWTHGMGAWRAAIWDRARTERVIELNLLLLELLARA